MWLMFDSVKVDGHKPTERTGSATYVTNITTIHSREKHSSFLLLRVSLLMTAQRRTSPWVTMTAASRLWAAARDEMASFTHCWWTAWKSQSQNDLCEWMRVWVFGLSIKSVYMDVEIACAHLWSVWPQHVLVQWWTILRHERQMCLTNI